MTQESNELLHLHTKLELRLIMLQCLKNLLCKIFSDSSNDVTIISYGLNNLTKKETMREIAIQRNLFLNEVNIVSTFSIIPPDNKQVSDILSDSLYFTVIEPTRKIATEKKYL